MKVRKRVKKWIVMMRGATHRLRHRINENLTPLLRS